MRKSLFPQSVADFCSRHSLLGTCGVVALSGGPDSVCLARIVHDLHREGVFTKVVLAHLNHQLRGPQSDADEAFVIELAQNWKLVCRTQRLDVAAVAHQDGANLEEAARRLRYDWLARVAQEEGAAWVATGHTADDQAETVLFRLLRGSGLQGLAGMAERRGLAAGVDLIRPMLGAGRDAVLAFLESHQQTFCHDASNEDRRFTRNRIRHELLPTLAQEFNPAIVETLCRLAEQAREVQDELMREAALVLAKAELPRAGSMVVLEVAGLATSSRHMQREVFRLVWQREHWPMGQMTFEAWDRLAQLVDGKTTAVDMPDGVRGQRRGGVVQLEKVGV
jgi:tRNA(Ile)-lysidine synthase